MKYLIALTLASIASAARLDSNVYLPPNARGSSGANAGLQTPFGSSRSAQYSQSSQGAQNAQYSQSVQNAQYSQNAQYAQSAQNSQYSQSAQNAQGQSNQNQAEILSYENEINDDGFHYAFETSDGTKAEQTGRVLPGATPEEGSLQVSGSYSYVGDDGQTYSVSYTADENGFQPQGDHLPTPPPIPEAILKSLQLTAGNGAQYDSRKSSYDADKNGY